MIDKQAQREAAENAEMITDKMPAEVRDAVNRLLDSDGCRGRFSAMECHEAHEELERLLAAEPVSQRDELPIQPLVIDGHGTLRFKENPIVRRLLDYSTEHGYGLNEMALEQFDAEDRMQLAQLIGYSLSGYGDLSYVTDESYARAAMFAAAIQQEAK
ncbi:hypothetical protein [Enterobacter hormaechei]|uniref:hypothetical protein n=1 Tax=Enterobacter hormaechei TaxID=158836 RepID=UPI00287555A6|nr:hypothetical protein [Enterobacter hormaechei]MDR9909384.1 hypothetical protein [Enterobacter hormaechei subsp. steigerwaltii]